MKKYIKVKPQDLHVDSRYQRDLDARRVAQMAVAIDPLLIGVPVISRRGDGTLWLLDGQHRVAALVEAGLGAQPIMAEVIDGLSVAEEASLFERHQRLRSAVRAFDQFKALVQAGDPSAVAIKRIVKAAGLTISAGKTGRAVSAVKALHHAYQRGHLPEVLCVLTMWSDDDPAVLDGKVIRAVSDFLTAYPEADLERLATKLQTYSPGKVMTKIKMRHDMDRDRRRAEATVDVIREIYNKGRGAKLPAKEAA